MKLVTKNYAPDDRDWAEYALIEITDATKKEILEARELFQMVHSKNKSLTQMEFWDGSAQHFVCCAEDAFTEAMAEVLEDQNFVHVDDDQKLDDLATAEESRTTCDCLVITSRGFYWSAKARHTSDSVETPELPYEMLLEK